MGNNLEFVLGMVDQFSPILKAAGITSETEGTRIASNLNKVGAAASNGFNHASSSAVNFREEVKHVEHGMEEFGEKVTGIFERIGIFFGAYEMIDFVKESLGETKQLNEAQAQLANTLKNSGKFTQSGFEEIIKSSSEMSEHILYSKGEVIDLQSQLRLVGNISESTMQRMVKDSADLATKLHMNLGEAGNALAKAVNDPEMMRRLGMQLKIDPGAQAYIQNLAKHGKEAQAQLLLLQQVEQKVGGAAEAAFNANPLAKFHKTIEDIQIAIGYVALPLIADLADGFRTVVGAVKDVINWFEQHRVLMIAVGTVLGTLTAIMIVNATWIGIVAAATKAWAAAQWVINNLLLANPVGLIVVGLIALVAAIGYVWYATKGWGKQWEDVMGVLTASWSAFKDSFSLIWDETKNYFLSGLDVIKTAWFELEKLWDKSAGDAGLKSINNQSQQRAAEIAKQKGVLASDLKTVQDHLKWDLSWDSSKSITGTISDLKKKLGFGGSANPITANGGDAQAGNGGMKDLRLPAGKDKADSINNGGQRSIVINIAKQIEKLEVHVADAKEGASEIETMVRESMRRVLLSLNGNAVSAK